MFGPKAYGSVAKYSKASTAVVTAVSASLSLSLTSSLEFRKQCMSVAEKIRGLLEWCTENGATIDQRLSIMPDPHGGIAVFTGNESIEPREIVVTIPKSSVLSTRSCCLSNSITPAMVGSEAQLALSTALYTEILLSRRSKWYGYLQSLPEAIDLPLCWKPWLEGIGRPSHVTSEDLGDIREALDWLRGTEAEKILLQVGPDIECIEEYFDRIVSPLVNEHMPGYEATLDGFIRTYCLVSSRAFLVDAFHGLSMVPIADAFNHVEDNHVHLESDYDVCPECGSLDECPHDRDASDHSQPTEVLSLTSFRYDYEMVTITAVPAFCEVYNTYGETLSNAELLCQYGFVLETNDNDFLTWTAEEILDAAACTSPSLRTAITQMCSVYWEDSDFLGDFDTSHCLSNNGSLKEGKRYTVNADGQASVEMWILLVAISMQQGRSHILDTLDSKRMLRSLYEIHIALESLSVDSDSDDTTDRDGDASIAALLRSAGDGCLSILRRSYQLLVDLCRSRNENTGKRTQGDEAELWDRLEALSTVNQRRTRSSLLLAMSEKLVLSSCEATWNDLLLALERTDTS